MNNTSLKTRTLEILDWPRIQKELAALTVSPLGEALALNLSPWISLAERAQTANHIAEILLLLADASAASLHSLLRNTLNPLAYFEKTRKGGVLRAEEVFICGHFFQTCGLLHQELKKIKGRFPSQTPLLMMAYETLPALPSVFAEIEKSVSSTGEVLDTASERIMKLRLERTEAKKNFEKLISVRIQEWHTDGILQDNFFDILGGRYVVPVKVERQSELNGSLHARSQTGQSIYLEPTEFLVQNNRIQGLELEIQKEEFLVLKDLSQKISSIAENYEPWVEPLARLDFFFGGAKLAKQWDMTRPKVSSELKLVGFFHPLLLSQNITPTTNTLELDENGKKVIIVCGPNTGGKTVLIKAVVLNTLLAMSGLFICAKEGSEVPHYDTVSAVIGDEQALDEGLSSFGAQIRSLKELLLNTQKHQKSLFVIDEILSSTDPEEASALARSFLEELLLFHVHGLVTSHFQSLASDMQNMKNMSVAAMGFETLGSATGKPTYKLHSNEIGSSHALEVAQGLGFPLNILQKAKTYLSTERIQYEETLKNLRKKEEALEERILEQRAQLTAEFETKVVAFQQEKEALHNQYKEFFENARNEMKTALNHLISRYKTHERQGILSKEKISQKLADEIDASIETLEASVTPLELNSQTRFSVAPFLPEVGQFVRIKSLPGEKGKILSLEGKKATLQIGPLRLNKPVAELEPFLEDKKNSFMKNYFFEKKSNLPGQPVLDLRGRRFEEAISEATLFLDQCFRSEVSCVKIVTGHGTGAIKAGIRELLKKTPYIKGHRPERANDDGAILVDLDL